MRQVMEMGGTRPGTDEETGMLVVVCGSCSGALKVLGLAFFLFFFPPMCLSCPVSLAKRCGEP